MFQLNRYAQVFFLKIFTKMSWYFDLKSRITLDVEYKSCIHFDLRIPYFPVFSPNCIALTNLHSATKEQSSRARKFHSKLRLNYSCSCNVGYALRISRIAAIHRDN